MKNAVGRKPDGIVSQERGTGLGSRRRFFFRQMLDRLVIMVLNLAFVFHDLAVKFINQTINRGIQVVRETFNVHGFTGQAEVDFGFLALFFLGQIVHGKDDGNVDHMIEMAFDAL
jgi:hypothetical protein